MWQLACSLCMIMSYRRKSGEDVLPIALVPTFILLVLL